MSEQFLDEARGRVGQLVAGKYQLLRPLGVGGMGAVYESQHLFTQRPVAVKLLHENYAKLPHVAKRFLEEAKATVHLRHPSVIEVLDAGQEADGKLYVVFELLRGRTLATALKGTVAPDVLLEAFIHLADALSEAHAQNLVHRDIKPENVFLVDGVPFPGRVKLLDFGIARQATGKVGDGLTQIGAVLGTPLYMSPEIMMGEHVEPAADLWSLGVTMFRAFGGRMPFTGDRPEAILRAILMQPTPSLREANPRVPEALAAIVEQTLAVERERRLETASALAAALRGLTPHVAAPAAVAAPQRDVPTAPIRDRSPLVRLAPAEPDALPTDVEPTRPAWEDALAEIEAENRALETAPPPEPAPAAPTRAGGGWLGRLLRRDKT
jgi:serine/threonine protein kinase